MSKDKDYISREEALSYPFANGKYDKKNASMEFIFGCEAYKEWLEGLPTVKDIRSKGHWIKHENYYWQVLDEKKGTLKWSPAYECSDCGSSGWDDVILNYCPCCGADMREE